MQRMKEQASADQVFLLAHQWHDASHSTWQIPQGKDAGWYLPSTELKATQHPSHSETQVLGASQLRNYLGLEAFSKSDTRNPKIPDF